MNKSIDQGDRFEWLKKGTLFTSIQTKKEKTEPYI